MPIRLRDLKRNLEALGCRVEPPGTGSHWKVYRADGGGRPYIIPAHNGPKSEIGDKYIKGLARSLSIDVAKLKG